MPGRDHIETLAIHAGQPPDPATGAVMTPIYQTATYPRLKLADLRAIAHAAHAANPNIRVIVDNTFATPYLQQPLALGCDVVVHSTTKYLGGHSDVVGGAVLTSDTALHEQLKFLQNAAGAVPGPMDCFLVLRGIKTLAVRMERHSENALAVAQYLSDHPRVTDVIYPGLEGHPQHELALRQMRSGGGMISFNVQG